MASRGSWLVSGVVDWFQRELTGLRGSFAEHSPLSPPLSLPSLPPPSLPPPPTLLLPLPEWLPYRDLETSPSLTYHICSAVSIESCLLHSKFAHEMCNYYNNGNFYSRYPSHL